MSGVRRAHTFEEMRFAASLEPCPACGTHDLGPLDLVDHGKRLTYRGPCPCCATPRIFEFEAIGNPRTARARMWELAPGPSELFTAEQFLHVLDEIKAKVQLDPKDLDAEGRARVFHDLGRAITAVTELLKLVPRKGPLPGAADPRLDHGVLEEEYTSLRLLLNRVAPTRALDHKLLDAHGEWLDRHGHGEGQLVLDGKNLANQHYPPITLTGAGFLRCDMTAIDLRYCRLDEATLQGDTLVRANLSGASLQHALVKGGNWRGINLVVAKLHAIDMYDVDLREADLDRSLWHGARVAKTKIEGARFGNATLDSAAFIDCTFGDASFARYMDEPTPTSANAVFTRCDFANTDWTGRDLSGTRFVECTFAGAHGKPSAASGLVLEHCDVDTATLLKRLV